MTPDINARITHDFGILALVAENLLEKFEEEYELSPRVTRCIVLLSKGDLSKLIEAITLASEDWRDIIMRGESYTYQGNSPFPDPDA